MKKILFVDHAFHKKTKSSNFIYELLKTEFEVDTLYVEPSEGIASDYSVTEDVEIVFIWQMDYLAPIFLNLGLPTIVVPMYDGSGQMPKSHWRLSSEARFVSFSFHLHENIRRAGGESLLVKYFPEIPEEAVTDFSELRAFLWQRAPQTNINWKFVNHIVGHQLSSLHVHDAPDDRHLDKASYVIDAQLRYPVTTSTWFEDRSDLETILHHCNIYIAPRPSEGIGMAFLEAMARGCCVLAHDLPTHNEYIMNWVNGILFNKDDTGPFNIDDPARIGHWARQTAIEGRKTWLNRDCGRILEFIEAAAKPKRSIWLRDYQLDRLVHSYTRSHDDYLTFLRGCEDLIDATSGRKRLAEIKQATTEVRNRFLDFTASGDGTSIATTGLEAPTDEGIWTTRQTTEFHVPLARSGAEACLLMVDVMAPPGAPHTLNLRLQINDEDAGRIELPADGKPFRARRVVPKAVRHEHMLYLKITSNCLVSVAGVLAGSEQCFRGFGIKCLGVFDLDHVPLKDIMALEEENRSWIGEPDRCRQFVIWCLENGQPFGSEDAVAAFDNRLVGSFAAFEVLENPRGNNAARMEMAWNTRTIRDGGVLGEVPIHALMDQILGKRPDVAKSFDLTTAHGLAGFLGWYYLIGIKEYQLDRILHPQEIKWLQGGCLPEKNNIAVGLSRIFYCLWSMRKDLQGIFDLKKPEGCNGLLQWINTSGRTEYKHLDRFLRTGQQSTFKERKENQQPASSEAVL